MRNYPNVTNWGASRNNKKDFTNRMWRVLTKGRDWPTWHIWQFQHAKSIWYQPRFAVPSYESTQCGFQPIGSWEWSYIPQQDQQVNWFELNTIWNQSRHDFMFEHEIPSAWSEDEWDTSRNEKKWLATTLLNLQNQKHKLQNNPRSLMCMAHAKWALELGV